MEIKVFEFFLPLAVPLDNAVEFYSDSSRMGAKHGEILMCPRFVRLAADD